MVTLQLVLEEDDGVVMCSEGIIPGPDGHTPLEKKLSMFMLGKFKECAPKWMCEIGGGRVAVKELDASMSKEDVKKLARKTAEEKPAVLCEFPVPDGTDMFPVDSVEKFLGTMPKAMADTFRERITKVGKTFDASRLFGALYRSNE